MKGSYRLFLAALTACAVSSVAQTGAGPQSNNSNRDEPQIKIQGQTPSGSQPGRDPAATAPAGTPAAGATAPTSAETPAATTDAEKPSGANAPAATGGASPSGEKSAAKPDARKSGVPGNVSVNPMPAPGAEPQTQLLPGADSPASADPLLQPAPLPPGDPATLIGGTADRVDRIRNRVVIQPFGGGKRMDIRFDDRSHFYRDGRETTILGINKGDRVYADTMLVGGKIFAKNLRVQTSGAPAEARGQLQSYDASTGRVTMKDSLTSLPVNFTVSPKTPVARQNGSSATIADLKPGTLVDVVFAPGRRTGEARQISILAQTGANYMFVGRITNVDLSAGVLALDNDTDNKNYEIRFNPSKVEQRELLVVGAEVAANTVFDGRTYTAETMTINPGGTATK